MNDSNARARGAEGITDKETIWKKRYAGGKYTLYAQGREDECDAVIRALAAAADLTLARRIDGACPPSGEEG
jgi:hypothetical protein